MKQRVKEMQGAVETLLAILNHNETREQEVTKQQAQQFLQTL